MKKAIRWILIALFWIAIWWLAALFAGYEVLLPSPAATVHELALLVSTAEFWLSTAWSLGRIILGFSIGLAVGVLGAILTSCSTFLRDLFRPMLAAVKATPVASFIILALVWLRVGEVPVLTSALIVLPVVWSNIFTGITQTDPQLLEMSAAFDMSFGSKLKHLYIPSVKPFFLAAISGSMGMAWKAGIAAEVICNPANSIGNGLRDSKIYLETPRLFAWTVVVAILSILLEQAVLRLLRRKEALH